MCTPNRLYLQGDVALREGPYISQDDVVLKLLGMYVAEVGRLYARLQLVQPAVHAPLEMEDVQQHTADYRCGCDCCVSSR